MPSRHQIYVAECLMIPKDVYSLLAKIYTKIFTAVISRTGIMDHFYSFCILIYSNFYTMNMHYLCNKKTIKVIKKEKKNKENLSLVD